MPRKTAVCFLLGLSPLALPLKKVFHGTVDYCVSFFSGVPPFAFACPRGFHKEVDIVEVLLAPATIISVEGKKKTSPNSQNKTEE